MTTKTCWILTNGLAGMESQARGLAGALDVAAEVKRVRLRWMWGCMRRLVTSLPLGATTSDSDKLAPPWPDLVISCGQSSAALARAVKAASGGRTIAVHIQNPGFDPRLLDLVIAPRHDGLAGANVVVTRAAIHPVTPEKLAEGVREWGPKLAHLPRPLVGVLVGGSNGRHVLSGAAISRLADNLAALSREFGAGLAVTPSRRTDGASQAALRARLASLPAYVWDGQGANPYFGLLGLADAIVVTEDSVSMISEALATGKPVYIASLEGGSRRLDRFTRELIEEGIARPFAGTFERWSYPRFDDTERAAAEIRRRFSWTA